MLAFGSVRNFVQAWVNGAHAARHDGYSTPFGFDLGSLIRVKLANGGCICEIKVY